MTNLSAEEINAVEQLKKYYGTKTESAAARLAILEMSKITRQMDVIKTKDQNQG